MCTGDRCVKVWQRSIKRLYWHFIIERFRCHGEDVAHHPPRPSEGIAEDVSRSAAHGSFGALYTACLKAPSVAVTWGWESHDLLVDLGNNARLPTTVFHFSRRATA